MILCRSEPATSTNFNSFQRAACNRFNMKHLATSHFNEFQYEVESGSGPGALPGTPPGSSLDSTAEKFRVLKAVEMRGFRSYKFDYSRTAEQRASFKLHSIQSIYKAHSQVDHLGLHQVLEAVSQSSGQIGRASCRER